MIGLLELKVAQAMARFENGKLTGKIEPELNYKEGKLLDVKIRTLEL